MKEHIEFIDGTQYVQMVLCASDALEANKQRLNDLNVFPVPDGDTGTNMSLTIAAAATELRKRAPSAIGDASQLVASAMLRGARGNSGVILSLLFRGISKELKGLETANSLEFSAAMSRGVRAAYKAVMKPTEGTILTVSRLASEAAEDFAKADTSFVEMLHHSIAVGREAVLDTQNLNPVLKKAGVVDAGGEGYIVIFDAMLAALEGRVIANETTAVMTETATVFESFNTEDIEFAYCTEFIVEKENELDVDELRSYIQSLGDSVVVVDDEEIIKTHVHTNTPDKALAMALKYGSLMTVKIENMKQQHTEQVGAGAAPVAVEPEFAEAEKAVGTVAICAGEGLATLFVDLGIDRVVSGGQTMNPSTEDILREVNRTPAETVFVFPNNKNIIMAAQQCDALTEKKVVVIPTKTVPQGITAMMNMAEACGAEELEEAFNGAIDDVHTILVTYAARDSELGEHSIKAGEYLTLVDGGLLGSFTDRDEMMAKIGDSIEQFEPEFISVYYGEDVEETEAAVVADVFENRFDEAEVTLLDGGQPVYYYMISVE